MIAVVAFIVFVERSERRIPIQSARRIVGRRMMGGQSSHLPLKVNSGGVMPVIFASSILSAPLLFGAGGLGAEQHASCSRIIQALRAGLSLVRAAVHAGHHLLRLFLCLDRDAAGRHCRQHAQVGLVYSWGIRPGKRTAEYINDILTRITLVGAVYLILVSPSSRRSSSRASHLNHLWLIGGIFEKLPAWVTNGMGLNFYFGGTSLLIVVGVAMDTANQIESQLIMRHYDGFSPRSGRVRGRKTW